MRARESSAHSRKERSKYREYETWDIFYLMTCMAYRSMGLSVKDIVAAQHHEPLSFIIEKVKEQQDILKKEIREKSMLLEYLENYAQRLEMMLLNLGNYWIVKRPEHAVLEYTNSENDEYAPIWADKEMFKAWMSKRPYLRNAQFLTLDESGRITNEVWAFVIEKGLMRKLNIPSGGDVYDLEEKLCMTTVIDGGDRGDLTHSKFEMVIDEVHRRGYEIDGRIMAFLINRHWEHGRYHRCIEVPIPIKIQKMGA